MREDGAHIVSGDINWQIDDRDLCEGNYVQPIVTEGMKKES